MINNAHVFNSELLLCQAKLKEVHSVTWTLCSVCAAGWYMSVTPAMQCWEHGCKEGCRLASQLYLQKDKERQTNNNKAETDSVHTHRYCYTLRQHISNIAIYDHYRHASGSVNDLEETSEQDSYEDLCVTGFKRGLSNTSTIHRHCNKM